MAYTYSKRIAIAHGQVPGPLTQYPFLFTEIDGDFATVGNGGHVQNTDAAGGASGDLTVPADMVFSPNGDGSSPYDHEFEKYDAVTGELVAWIEIPTLSSTQDTVLYVVYGDVAVVTTQEYVRGVWSGDYQMVQHLNETSGAHFDSTGASKDSTGISVAAQGTAVGKADGCDDFEEASDHYVGFGQVLGFAGFNLTLEAWIKPESLPTAGSSNDEIVCKYRDDRDKGYRLSLNYYNGNPRARFAVGNQLAGSASIWGATAITTTGIWYYLAGTYNTSTQALIIYLNGVPDGGGSSAGGIGSSFPRALSIGRDDEDGGRYFFDGLIDEVRMSNWVKPPDYFTTTFNNIGSPGTFYSKGSEGGATTTSTSSSTSTSTTTRAETGGRA